MIYLLVDHYWDWLQVHDLRFLRVFRYASFQASMALLLAFFMVIVLGPRIIAWLRKQKIGDHPEFYHAEMNQQMGSKKGTPTMGGVLIITAIACSTLLLADLSNFYVQMALVCLFWLGAVGAVDDWLKLTVARRSGSRQGLTTLEKLLFQIGLGVVLSYFIYQYGQDIPARKMLYLPFLKNVAIPLGLTSFVIIGTLVMTGASNAVNLTDGLDGLAAGCTSIVSFSLLILALIVGTAEWANTLLLPYIQASDQMAVLAGAMTGSALGFLWYNCNPAKVFMGDTGSLSLGGLLGYIAIVTRQELMLFMIGGIFVLEAASVMLQVGYFKYTRRRYGQGRRIFLMSPLHHHFQQKGWTENQVVVRFWLITAMLAAMALATVKLR